MATATRRKRSSRKPRQYEGRSFGSAAAPREWSEAEKVAWREKKRREADSALGEIVEMFSSGELPSLVAQTMIVRAEGTSPIVNWSLGNQLLCLRAGTTDARGFRQWKEVGRSVRKGARAFRIMAPVLLKSDDQDAGDGEKRERLVGYRMIPVFAIQSTEGMPLEDPLDYRPPELPPLYDVAERLGVKVDYMPAHALADFRGFYSPGRREIALVTHDVSTFFHELAHAAHDAVLQADGKRIADVPAADLEIVAETVAATLCHLHDYDGYVFDAAKYVEHFAEGGNPGRAAMRVLGDVAKVLYLILDPPQWNEVPVAA